MELEDLYLRIYPDPILKKKALPFQQPLPENIQTIGERMLEIMYESNGIGLAGPQAGISKRIIVYDLSENRDEPHILINPEIVSTEGGKVDSEEGCLSFPDINGFVKRDPSISVKGLLPDGSETNIQASELMAAMFQHEIDHLDGITFVDRLSPTGKIKVKKQLKSLESEFNSLG